MTISESDEFKDAKAGGDEYCPDCDSFYLPFWEPCRCTPERKLSKKEFDEICEKISRDLNIPIPKRRK
jgi:hypothetical protein